MTFTEACKPFINRYGTFNQTPNEEEQNSGNSLLFMGTYYQIKYDLNELKVLAETGNFYNALSNYRRDSGILNRYPNNTEILEAHDDYIGVLNASSIFDSFWSGTIFTRRHYYWNFNNVSPREFTFQTWFARFPGFISHVYFANNLKPSLLNRLTWITKVVLDSFNNDSMSDKILTWHMIKCYERTNFRFTFCDLAVKLWKNKLIKNYKDKMGTVFQKYYNADHPFSVYMKGRI